MTRVHHRSVTLHLHGLFFHLYNCSFSYDSTESYPSRISSDIGIQTILKVRMFNLPKLCRTHRLEQLFDKYETLEFFLQINTPSKNRINS